MRANEAERRLISGADANEGRVAALELKLSELSDFIGNYDRLRIQDQTAIIKLKVCFHLFTNLILVLRSFN